MRIDENTSLIVKALQEAAHRIAQETAIDTLGVQPPPVTEVLPPPPPRGEMRHQGETMVFTARPVPDLNNVAAASTSQAHTAGSRGKASQARPSDSHADSTRFNRVRQGSMTPCSQTLLHDGLVVELQAEFYEWMQQHDLGIVEALPPRRGDLTPNQTARRARASASTGRQRSSISSQRRETPRGDFTPRTELFADLPPPSLPPPSV